MKLSIIVPAHNEEARIKPMLEAYLPFFAEHYGNDFELIVVVNGSTDSTAEMVTSYIDQFPQVRLIDEPSKIGKGGAIMLGFAAAKGAVIGFVDADGSTPPFAYQDLVDNLGSDGAMIASRWVRDAVVSPRQPLSRRVASRCFNKIVKTLFKLDITDTQCGAKVLSREAIEKITPHLGLTRWAFDVDLLFQLRRAGFRIREIPTTWSEVEGSKLRVLRVSFDMFLAICRLRILHSPLKWVVTLYDVTLGHVVNTKA